LQEEVDEVLEFQGNSGVSTDFEILLSSEDFRNTRFNGKIKALQLEYAQK
jgi:hypothetical protein